MPKSVKVDESRQPLKHVYLRMPQWMIDALKQVSMNRGIPYQVLIRVWLGDRLAEELDRRAEELEAKKRARRAR